MNEIQNVRLGFDVAIHSYSTQFLFIMYLDIVVVVVGSLCFSLIMYFILYYMHGIKRNESEKRTHIYKTNNDGGGGGGDGTDDDDDDSNDDDDDEKS